MPAFDACHEQVVRALQKAGWRLEGAPARVSTPYRTVYIDLEMSQGLNGSLQHIMFLEVKCFPDKNSTTTDLYISLGQYLIYRAMLIETLQTAPLYLAVPETIFATVFDKAVMGAVGDSHIRLVVINLDEEEVVKWIE